MKKVILYKPSKELIKMWQEGEYKVTVDRENKPIKLDIIIGNPQYKPKIVIGATNKGIILNEYLAGNVRSLIIALQELQKEGFTLFDNGDWFHDLHLYVPEDWRGNSTPEEYVRMFKKYFILKKRKVRKQIEKRIKEYFKW